MRFGRRMLQTKDVLYRCGFLFEKQLYYRRIGTYRWLIGTPYSSQRLDTFLMGSETYNARQSSVTDVSFDLTARGGFSVFQRKWSSIPSEKRKEMKDNEPFLIRLPDLGIHVHIAVKEWYKRIGEEIQVGERICQIETKDIVLDIAGEKHGFLAEINIPQGKKGELIPGTILGSIVGSKDQVERKGPANEEDNGETLTLMEEHQAIEKPNAEKKSKENDETSDNSISKEIDYQVEILRQIKEFVEKGKLLNVTIRKRIESLARNSDERLINVYKASLKRESNSSNSSNSSRINQNDMQLDETFFIENIIGLAEDTLAKESEERSH